MFPWESSDRLFTLDIYLLSIYSYPCYHEFFKAQVSAATPVQIKTLKQRSQDSVHKNKMNKIDMNVGHLERGVDSNRFLILSFLQFISLHKEKKSFPLRFSSVNVTKSAVSCEFGHIHWRNP